MLTFVSNIFTNVAQYILGLTLYKMMQSSYDFADVKEALNGRVDWSIELFRSCLTVRLTDGGYFFMLCSLSFLVMAENIHIYHARLSPAELKERAEDMGYVAFATVFAILDIGFVIVRIAGLIALSGSPAIATSLVLISMSPLVVLPMLTYPAKLLKRKKHASGGEVDV